MNQELIIDAKGKSLGRVATLAAAHLRGKNSTNFTPHLLPQTTVKIINAGDLVLTGKKLKDEVRISYSGYPGGLKRRRVEKIVAEKGHAELCREAILGMIPRNKLRPKIIKHLTVTN